jgi:hypothetical protein
MENSIAVTAESMGYKARGIDALYENSVGELKPYWSWKEGKAFYPTPKERLVAETFIKTHSYKECERVLKLNGTPKSAQTCKRWLETERMADYIKEAMKERGLLAGWTKGRWLVVMTEHLDGTKRLKEGDLYAMKLMKDALNFSLEGVNSITQINFMQSD